MSHQLTVYVIDQDLATRRTIASQLGAIGAEAWPFAGAAEFLEIIDHLMPACILLDMDMPDIGGLQVMAELSRREIDWPIIALSAGGELAVAVEAMKRGAIDFLRKPLSGEALAAALVPAWRVLEKSIETNDARREAQERIAKLTPREVDVSLALLAGSANKMVAHQFGISVRTVEMHRAHIMAKLEVRSLAEAALLVTQAGLSIARPAKQPAREPLPRPSASVTPLLRATRGTETSPMVRRQLNRSALSS